MFGKKKIEEEKNKKEGEVELAESKTQDNQAAVGEMLRGDYRIHVYIEKAKDLKVPENSTIDPLVEISCLNLKQYTTVKEKIGGIGETVWNEHVFLEPRNVEKQSAEDAKITLKILDKGILKNTQIGQFEFDLSFIYFKKEHALLHQWVAVSDPNSENYSEITGYLKISINVTCQGDEPIQINDDDGVDDSNIMMPPSLNPKFHQIKIRFFQAQDLAMMDIGIALLGKKSKTDAYFTTTYKKKQLKTQIKVFEEGKKSIDINEEIWIPAQVPIIQKKLVVKLMDYDVDGDEVVGSLQFDMKDIIEGAKNKAYMWKNIYGSPISTSIISGQNKAYKKIMDENPELASSWKGRVLMQIECYDTEKPEAKVQRIDQEIIDDSVQYTVNKKYEIIAEVGQGVALPENKKFQVKFIIGGKELITEQAGFQKSNYNRFNKRFDQQTLLLPYLNIEDFGSIIIVLMDEDKPICFYKESVLNFKQEEAEYKWIQLVPDKCINHVKDSNKAGLISFKFSISQQKNIDFKNYKTWKKLPSKRANPVLIRAYIFQCRDLPASDDDGGSDPYVKLWDLSGKEKKTRVIYDNVNPLFFQVVELEYEIRDDMDDLFSYPPFIVDVFDHDDELFDSSPDYLGRAIIEPEDCSITVQSQFEKNKLFEIPQIPRWHPLRFAAGEPVCGQILVSFSVSTLEYNYQHSINNVDLRSRVEFKEFDVSMLILGLRELQSPGILPVKKAYINFNVKSLVPAENTAIQNIQTQPQASGPNPTINTTIEFSIPLPTDQLYCPRMSCMVYDYIYLGFSQPQIGVFTIPIGDIMIDLKKERKEELKAIQFICDELNKIIQAGPDLNIKNFSKNKMLSNGKINTSDNLIFKNNLNKSINQSFKSNDSEIIQDGSNDDDLTGLIKKELNDSVISNSLKAKKKSSNRTKSSASSVSDVDQIGKQKKQYGKKIKGSDIEQEMKEKFGANHRQGEIQAEDTIDQQLKSIQQRRESVKQTGLFPNQIQEGNGNLDQRKGSLAKFSGRKDSVVHRNSVNKYDALKVLQEDKEQEKRILEDNRKQAQEDLHSKGQESTSIIIIPQYELDKRLKVFREVQPPSSALYEGLGWDEDIDNPTKHQKHYRLFYNDELENVKDIFPKISPFNSYNITKGQDRGISKSIFSMFQKTKKDESGQESTKKKVGTFKGIIEVESKEDKENYKNQKNQLIDQLKEQISTISQQKTGRDLNSLDIDVDKLISALERKKVELKFRELGIDHLSITKHLADLESEVILKRLLMKKTKCVVRFYAINADHLSSRDIGSDSDPYLFLTCNDKTYNERSNYQLDNPNPKFYKYYDFEGTFPGCSPLKIDIYDYDDIFGDDLIGSTSIDLEDRYFSLEWQSLNEKPIEVRQIYIQSSQIDQGTIKCWVEINDIDTPKEQIKEWDISEKPAETFEIRICVFNCKEVKMMDIEGTSDVFCRGFFDSKEDVQETDTHYRNQDGKPDFQYRLVYQFQYPRKNNDYKFSLQMFDRDFFKSNDMIGSTQIDLKNIIEDCSLTKQPLSLNESYYKDVLGNKFSQKLTFEQADKSKFWLDMKSKNKENKKLEVNGQVKLQIDVLPIDLAEKNKVGKARDQPNHSPQLPQPEGRLELSINPFKMFNQLVGPAMRAKIYCALCVILASILFVAVLPNIAGAVIANSLPHF